MTGSSMAHDVFLQTYEEISIKKMISCKSTWSDGTGEFRGATPVDSVDFEGHHVVAAKDPNGRRILLYQTPLGNIVVFERYVDSKTLAFNMPEEIASMDVFPQHKKLGFVDLLKLVGGSVHRRITDKIQQIQNLTRSAALCQLSNVLA